MLTSLGWVVSPKRRDLSNKRTLLLGSWLEVPIKNWEREIMGK
jgi:hypothetical protein